MTMHEDQIHIDLDIARQLIADDFPQLRGESITRVISQGTVNSIYRVGDVVAARFPLRASHPQRLESELERESEAMSEFATWCPFASPRPLGIGRPGRSFPLPWSLQSWVEGEIATPTGLSASSIFADDIAILIESLRAADTRGRRFTGTGRGGRISDHDEWMATCFESSIGLLDVARLRGVWRRLRELAPPSSEVMSHRDLIPANILVRGEHIVGVLDAGDFGPADPALDLVSVWHLLDAERRELVRSRLHPPREEWLRGAAWAFQQAMGLVWYYQRTNPGISELGRSTLRRLVDDPEVAVVSG